MSATDSASDELYEADCGHRVPKERTVSVPEVTLCDECYTAFSVEKWPDIIGNYEHRVIEGAGRGTSKVLNQEYLLGLDRRGRAVYYDGENSRVKTYVPMHDRAYKRDRDARAEVLSERHTPEKGMGVLRPKKKGISKPEPAPAIPGDFVTLPDGDHIVMVEVTEKMDYWDLEEWMEENTGDWQQVLPQMVEKFELQHKFGMESGRPLTTSECQECGHVETEHDPKAIRRCPECDSHKFYGGQGR